MRYEFEINDKSCSELGIVIGRGSIDALHAPVQRKDYITNENAGINGVQYLAIDQYVPKVASRDVNLVVYLMAKSKENYWTAYNRLTELLGKGGLITLTEAVYEDGADDTDEYACYRLIYKSCTQFSEFNGRMAKLQLRFTEPDPANRNIVYGRAGD